MSSNLDGCWPAAARNGDDAMIGYSDLMRCGLVFILSPLLMCAGVRGGSVKCRPCQISRYSAEIK